MEKSEKFRRIFEGFEKAFGKYREVVKSKELFDFLNQELIIEVTTKRFEYTFESLWAVLKEYLRSEGVDCPTPLKCFKEAFKSSLIDEAQEGVFIEMIEKRNQIVHVYDLKQAEDIYAFIKSEEVFSAIEAVYDKLKSEKQENK
ncbi:MAG: HI0074 family nucleotidyltransferase substrate-binding subunit [Candidatus Omnitrophota bacterium]